jgi:gamma-glutamylcysteine synthetase
MEAIGIPHNDFSHNYLRNGLDGTMAVTTHPQIFEDAKCSTRGCADQAECNCQILTVMTQTQHLVFILYIM